MLGSPTAYDWFWVLVIMGCTQAFVQIPFVARSLSKIAPSVFGRIVVGIVLGLSAVYAGAKNGISPRAYVCQYITAKIGRAHV